MFQNTGRTVSISYGFATYNSTVDKTYKDVYIRADREMMLHKEEVHYEHGM